MATKWPLAKLGDHVDILTGFPFKSAEFTDSGVRLARGDNVKRGYFEWGKKTKYWPSITEDVKRYALQEGDVLIGMDGSRVGENWVRVRADDLPCLLVQRVARLRSRDTLNQRFLWYLISNAEFVRYVKAVHTGTSIPHISQRQIADFDIPAPPIHIQDKIANILGSLDDKIDLNRQISRTLEQWAQALFKSWFINFDPVVYNAVQAGNSVPEKFAETAARYRENPDVAPVPQDILERFPISFEDSEYGPIPAGWYCRPLDQVADFLNGLACQKYPPDENYPSLPVIKIRELRNGLSGSTDYASAEVPGKFIVEDGDVLFSWSGSLLIDAWTQGRGVLNQHVFKVTSDVYPKWFYYYWTLHHLEGFSRIAADKATTMGHIRRHHLTDALVVVPDGGVSEVANEQLAPLFEREVQSQVETRKIASVRDALLPKLVSGEVRVRDAEDMDAAGHASLAEV